eukprot:TRINITY_DN34520_c0_g1_i1.p1 TRINITY_DN34520_c0_g1~~TRINITY_DN34520_c0_g1_i1.p1  ORF type:complete len:474 (+),score=83.66 TRINITY_DN34520_c0_g1_i1:178-1599(+)
MNALSAPTIVSVHPDAIPPCYGIDAWIPPEAPCGDSAGLDAADYVARESLPKLVGKSGCAIASASMQLVAACASSPLLTAEAAVAVTGDADATKVDANLTRSILPPEIGAVAHCARLGLNTNGGAAYCTTLLNKRTFMTLAVAGLNRVAMAKELVGQESKDIEAAASRLGIQLVLCDDTSRSDQHGIEATSRCGAVDAVRTADVRSSLDLCKPPQKASLEPAATIPTTVRPAEPSIVPNDVDLCGWSPRLEASVDENGLELSLVLARNSRCRNGSMGCAVVSPSGDVLAVAINSPFWGGFSSPKPPSDVHAEVNAVGSCVRRGVAMGGATVYITMPPCRRCFQLLALSGVRRIVVRQEPNNKDAAEPRAVAERLGISFVVSLDTDERRQQVQRLVSAAKRRRCDEPQAAAEECGVHVADRGVMKVAAVAAAEPATEATVDAKAEIGAAAESCGVMPETAKHTGESNVDSSAAV